MWSGLLANVPDGWSVCDGTNGTPDLRNRFIRAASGEAGGAGGDDSHNHFYSFTIFGTDDKINVEAGALEAAAAYHSHVIFGSTGSNSSLPPYYELIYIRKD